MNAFKSSKGITVILLLTLLFAASCDRSTRESIDLENYFAWCVVPFDNQKRSPEQRIEMLKELGFQSYAYDWRAENLPEMAYEIQLAQENNINVKAVWMWINKNDSIGNLSENNKKVLKSLRESGLNTEIWVSFPENYFEKFTGDTRLTKAVEMISFVCMEAEKLNCKVGLYNHGGWFGNPENLVKIIESIKSYEIGIIFNFHHAHKLLDNYSQLVKMMAPYLWAVNLNGMNPEGPKILTIGKGSKEAEMIAVLEENNFYGPYGILGHVESADVKQVLQANLEGLKSLHN